ncbi:hypothetical protein O181_061391 [Austropuccinia psidii MF-1]|uniref:Integrase zinc-binding domain-containing protein n=1 Tax=Austropuccinia psidii MF-1 TaxID=1389203 RepID=A0A9Q3EMP7_9BASI|nr:hypothetical protein [Austropuccinia psidii MF-1]
MTIVHKAGSIHKNGDGLSGWALANTPDNPAYVPLEVEPQIPIEGINITDIGPELFEELVEYYNQDKNCHILTSLLDKYCKDTALVNSLHEVWKDSYSDGSIYSGHLKEEKTLEKVKNCAWWTSWRTENIEFCHSCDRCQKETRSKGKKFRIMIHIQEPKSPWELFHMDWVTALPARGGKSYYAS